VTVLERLSAKRGGPAYLRCDNETELTARALRDGCGFIKASTSYIDPGSPWQNAVVESFNGRVRDELLKVEEFSCLAEAPVVIGDWHEDDNTRRAHSALGTVRRPRTPRPGRQARRPVREHPQAVARADGSTPLGSPSGLAFATSFRPASLLACWHYIHPVSHNRWTENGVRSKGVVAPQARRPTGIQSLDSVRR
jgi:hypothetical protein